MANALEAAPTIDNQIFVLDAQVVTSDPNGNSGNSGAGNRNSSDTSNTGTGDTCSNGGDSTPPPYVPKTHNLKSRIPQGAISVAQYRDWLTQQLALLNSFNEKDSVNLNE